MKPFGISIKGRVKNFSIPLSQPLLPLYEAVVNAFHAIDERREKDPCFDNPSIIIELEREGQLSLSEDEGINPIQSISISDNGIGFDYDNFKSFLESDSTYKEAIGGKGVGRFSWLVAFEKASIESVFIDEEGVRVKRSFEFSLNSNGIDDKLIDCDEKENLTCVHLINYKSNYQKNLPKQLSTIATRIIHYCLIYFMNSDCPTVILRDGSDSINLNSLFNEKIRTENNTESFNINNQSFELLHVKVEDVSINQNQLFLCANDRLVETKDLSKYITDLDRSIFDRHGFWYVGVLKGQYLDDNVDMNRLSFNIPEGGFVKDFISPISMDQIIENCTIIIQNYLTDYLSPISKDKTITINNYVTKKAPQFRHLLKYMPDEIARIKPNLTEEKLDDELHKIKRKFDAEVRSQNNQLLEDLKEGIVTSSEYQNRFKAQIKKVSDANSAVLAEYVSHRKIILDLLSIAIQKNNEGSYELEKYIHNLIYPMRSSSTDEPYDCHNLWLLDEKLAYCSYISSDIPFNNDPKDDRADILILDKPVAVSEGTNDGTEFDAIILFEIKRPMRNDYSDSDNPILQLYKYVDKLKTNKVKDKNGRLIRIGSNTKFYLYAICDITEKLEKTIAHSGLLKQTPDRLGYYGYHDGYNAYIEILPFNKIINDASKRNRVLFDKLGL